ncbi:GIY-YIG nuclease family protein [Modicisalibacter luteus]|uniref:GIY-YIG nuclease family protein n=1 Tax=Modicisalibacter luteus TaxID=453962 RepID=UPI0036410FE8
MNSQRPDALTGAADTCWFLYMIETAAGALYTGITTDVERRFGEHCGSRRGARHCVARAH